MSTRSTRRWRRTGTCRSAGSAKRRSSRTSWRSSGPSARSGSRAPRSTSTEAPLPPSESITVKVIFFADLRRFLPKGADGPQPYAVPAGATVKTLMDTIGIEDREDITIAVDGDLADRQQTLRDGSEVML